MEGIVTQISSRNSLQAIQKVRKESDSVCILFGRKSVRKSLSLPLPPSLSTNRQMHRNSRLVPVSWLHLREKKIDCFQTRFCIGLPALIVIGLAHSVSVKTRLLLRTLWLGKKPWHEELRILKVRAGTRMHC